MKIRLRNLSRNASVADLQRLFTAFGKVESANIMRDGVTGESTGYAIVSVDLKDSSLPLDLLDGVNFRIESSLQTEPYLGPERRVGERREQERRGDERRLGERRRAGRGSAGRRSPGRRKRHRRGERRSGHDRRAVALSLWSNEM